MREKMNKRHGRAEIYCRLALSLPAIGMAISSCDTDRSSGQNLTPASTPTSTQTSSMINFPAAPALAAKTRPSAPTFTPSPTPLASWCPVQEPDSASGGGKLTIAYIRENNDNSQKDAWLWTEDASPIRLTRSEGASCRERA